MKKETLYTCFECKEELNYRNLEKKLVLTVNFKTESYLHRCPKCKGTKFTIMSKVERL